MNRILPVVIVMVVVFFVIQNNNRFEGIQEQSSKAGETIISGFKNLFEDKPGVKRYKLVNTLRNISDSDKVVLTDVVEKWSLNKNIIDTETKNKSIEIVKEVMDTLEFFSDNKYHVENIENVYVMKDGIGNYRTIISAFIYDIKNFHTVKIILDVVYFEKIMYINHIDIDESGVKNVLQHYDIKYKSSGILSNQNNFNSNVEALLDNYYQEKYKVVPLQRNKMADLSGVFSFTALQKKLLPKEAPDKSPDFCNKESFDWNMFGIQGPGKEDCTFNNPSIRTYPPQPVHQPGTVVNNVDVNPFSWMWDPERGHTTL